MNETNPNLMLQTALARSANGLATGAQHIVDVLIELGVNTIFGVTGGQVFDFWLSAERNRYIHVYHCRHEAGAAFCAAEASLATDRPMAVMAIGGPGVSNALTGIAAARDEGAKLVLISGSTPAAYRGRWAFQETSPRFVPADFCRPGALFDVAAEIDDIEQLPVLRMHLLKGCAGSGPFIAHLALSPRFQKTTYVRSMPQASMKVGRPSPSAATIARLADVLQHKRSLLWCGFGARKAATTIRALVEVTGVPVICTPRGKGVVPDDHPLMIGATGIATNNDVAEWVADYAPEAVFALGSRLDELASLWDERLLPSESLVHVDEDPASFGGAYPMANCDGVVADIDLLCRALLATLAGGGSRRELAPRPPDWSHAHAPSSGCVRPSVLMAALQRLLDANPGQRVFAEAGNSFLWTATKLIIREPGQLRLSTLYGSMGHFSAAAVGVALATGQRPLAVVGDGSLLMNNEINTAVTYGAKATWIVLNDSLYNMVEQVVDADDMIDAVSFAPVDWVAVARGLGAEGIRVCDEHELDAALAAGLAAPGPFVIDVVIDPYERAPVEARKASLANKLG